jgi:pimeloyl-ACP methyl ester carboxylesterase
MNDPDMQPDQPDGGRRIRRAYLALVLGAPWLLIVLGAALIGAAFLSTQPTEVRSIALIAGVVLSLVGALIVRLAGSLEVSVPQGGVKATVDAIPRETLLLAQRAAAEVLPGEDAGKQAVAAEAVLHVLRRDRAAEVLAEVRTLLIDAAPDQLAFNLSDRTPEILSDLRERQQRIRGPLLAVTAGNSSAVANLGIQLEKKLADTLYWDGWLVADLVNNRDAIPAREAAFEHHTESLRLLDQLVGAIQ